MPLNNMDLKERKEVIQVNGVTILVVIALIANFLIVGFFYRWHGWQLFADAKRHNVEYTQLLRESHQLKQEIIAMEGVTNWTETAFYAIVPSEDINPESRDATVK